MVLNYIWIFFFITAFVVAVIQTLFYGNLDIWSEIMNSTFSSAKTAFEISLGLTGVLSLWLGLMKIGERGGVIATFSRWISPLFTRLFPELPKNHPAFGSIFMNISANMLGLDNAATPLGLKAMKEMQEVNPHKETASNPMIMFLVLNTTGLTIVPLGVMVYRAQMGAANPSDIFLPILIATFCSTLVGLIAVCIKQRINLFDKVILGTIGGLTILIGGILVLFAQLPPEKVSLYSGFGANCLLFSIVTGFLISGIHKRILYRRSQRRIQNRRYHYSLLSGDTCRHCSIPGFGCYGFFYCRHYPGHRSDRYRLRFRRSVADGPDEAAERQRGSRNDGRRHVDLRSRFFCRPRCIDHTRFD